MLGLSTALLVLTPRLTLELALDELGSFWVVKDGLSQAIDRSLRVQGQSPFYYILLWASADLFGISPVSLRFISLICTSISCVLIFQLGRLLFNRTVGSCSIFCFLCIPSVIQSATEARPYALAISLMLATSVVLIKWNRTLHSSWSIAYAILLAATVYAHFLYALLFLVHCLWVVIAISNSTPKQKALFGRQFVSVVVLLGVALWPAIFQVRALSSRGGSLSFVTHPSMATVLDALFPLPIVLALALVLAFEFIVTKRSQSVMASIRKYSDSISFVVLFLLIPPLAIVAFSHVFEHSLFVERYYSQRITGIALLGGMVFGAVSLMRNRLVLLGTLIAVTAFNEYHHIGQKRAAEGWKSAIKTIAERDPLQSCPVLLLPGFIESQSPQLLVDTVVGDFLRSPTTYYQIKSRIVLLPYTFETDGQEKYYSSTVEPEIKAHQCVWLLYRNAELFVNGNKFTPAPHFLMHQLTTEGFRSFQTEQFGMVELAYFERPKNP